MALPRLVRPTILTLAALGIATGIFLRFFAGERAASRAAQMERGRKIYAEKCLLCHQPTGLGAPPVYPPLAGSDWLAADRKRAIRVLCEGLSGPIAVNGVNYSNSMP